MSEIEQIKTNIKHSILSDFFRKCHFLYGENNPYKFIKDSIPHNLSEFESVKIEWVIILSQLEEDCLCNFDDIKIFIDTFHLHFIYSKRPPTFYELYNCIKRY